ncbi:DUF4129 domain-containing protein [Virgisporangium ochraceum]|uniref:Protein-glutamine gamma-glutamyltransferase-like C-terminal domain-containing protein n=1 Tax=Virgisporangium ochraceum TaxID=65505 RepID=A0A8J4ECC7_9ACTN|nr:DUF4129 domain-containing protein [Virgisporangium ochraceum]GIJ69388.1 hypothetical protein Voc01_043050 [Virgisporangium ochraceum]
MRWWNEVVAVVGTVLPLPTVVLAMLTLATIVALLWYFFPAWIPRRWPRLRMPRLSLPKWRLPKWRRPSWRRRRAKKADEPGSVEPVEGDEVPELPATTFADLADRLAAEGRFAEAVRERLRGMVRELIERGVLEHRPGWTVTELAAVAASRRPQVADPLDAAGQLFSDIWYGGRPAGADQYQHMRGYAAAQSAALAPAGVGR